MQVEEAFVKQNFIVNNDNISEDIRNDIEKAIENIIQKEKYIKYVVNKQIITSNGNNFLGVLCEVNIKGETDKGDNETNIFMKICNPNEELSYIDILQGYASEFYVYKELSNIYANLQEEFHVPLKERFEMVKFFDSGSQEVIALENMVKRGFVTYHRKNTIDLKFIELAVIELAKFHALSFVVEHKNPTYFERKIKNIEYPLNFNEDWKKFVTNFTAITKKLVNEDVKTKIVKYYESFTEKYEIRIKDENTVRCLCHGDYRPANILMKKVDGEVIKVLPIDYQIINYGSPVLDFIYLIFVSTDREFRSANLHNLKDLYHDTLKKFLEYFNIKVENVYPRKEFEKAFKEKLDYGLLTSVILIPILFSENDLTDLARTTISTHQGNDECKRRLQGLFEEFIYLGYL